MLDWPRLGAILNKSRDMSKHEEIEELSELLDSLSPHEAAWIFGRLNLTQLVRLKQAVQNKLKEVPND